MKQKYNKYVLSGIIIIGLLFLLNEQFTIIEYFTSINIQMYVISLKHDDRLENIKKQENKINKKITIFDAIKGDQLNIDQTFENGTIDEKYKNATKQRKRVIACYMSHLNLLKEIKINNIKDSKYSIIFEDDFDIVIPNFLDEVKNILDKLDKKKLNFDMIFLGNLNNNKGDNVIDNIYEMDKNEHLWGTHSYIVNNNNIDKILDEIKLIDMPIDNKYEKLGKNKNLKIYVINPTIVNQSNNKLPSNINELSIETFSNMRYI